MSWSVQVRAELGRFSMDVSLEGDRSTPVALVGPNGCGKTTLLRVIAGAHRPQSGVICFEGRTLFDAAQGVDVPIEARRVGYVPQGAGLFPHLNALDNVAFGLVARDRRSTRAQRRAEALGMLTSLGCEALASRSPGTLSGGERQRVALARALVTEPAVLLLDEPLAAIDVASRRRLRVFLAEHLRAQARPTLLVTHDVRDVAALGATVCVLEGGRVVQQGDLDALRAAPVNDFVAEFVDVPAIQP